MHMLSEFVGRNYQDLPLGSPGQLLLWKKNLGKEWAREINSFLEALNLFYKRMHSFLIILD